MTTIEKKHELRERLSLISTSVYLLLHAKDEDERIDRCKVVQDQIDAIIDVIDECQCPQLTHPDVLFQ